MNSLYTLSHVDCSSCILYVHTTTNINQYPSLCVDHNPLVVQRFVIEVTIIIYIYIYTHKFVKLFIAMAQSQQAASHYQTSRGYLPVIEHSYGCHSSSMIYLSKWSLSIDNYRRLYPKQTGLYTVLIILHPPRTVCQTIRESNSQSSASHAEVKAIRVALFMQSGQFWQLTSLTSTGVTGTSAVFRDFLGKIARRSGKSLRAYGKSPGSCQKRM